MANPFYEALSSSPIDLGCLFELADRLEGHLQTEAAA